MKRNLAVGFVTSLADVTFWEHGITGNGLIEIPECVLALALLRFDGPYGHEVALGVQQRRHEALTHHVRGPQLTQPEQ